MILQKCEILFRFECETNQPTRKLKCIVLYGFWSEFSQKVRPIRFFSNTWLCIKSEPTLLFAFALSLTLRAQKWAVVSRLDFLFSFLNSHRGEKLWQLHLIPRPRLTKYQILTKLYFIHAYLVYSAHCAFQNISLRLTHVFMKNGKQFFKNFLTLRFWRKKRSHNMRFRGWLLWGLETCLPAWITETLIFYSLWYSHMVT